jgi:uncharacterized SAM-binding protein YcdF (DUF218 family)
MNKIARATKTKQMAQTLRAALRRSQAAFWQTGKILALVAVLIALMLWLSGAFLDKIRADTPAAAQKTPAGLMWWGGGLARSLHIFRLIEWPGTM